VVEDICWGVWHRNVISATAYSSVGDWQGESTCGEEPRTSAVT
jgi:hypothetical protein